MGEWGQEHETPPNSHVASRTKLSVRVLTPRETKPFYQVKEFGGNPLPLLSQVRLFATPWIAARQASLSITNSRSLPKLMPIESVMSSNHLILCHPLLLPPSIFLSIRVFFNESALHIRWPNYWSFSFSISPSNQSSRLICFRIDWFNLLAVQGTLKSLFQHNRSKASIPRLSAFFIVTTLTSIHDYWKNHSFN